MYIKSLKLTSDADEITFIKNQVRTCYNGVYPFKIFPEKGLNKIDFSPITIFYGGNGSGKTTLLNILAELTGVTRHSVFSGSVFFNKSKKHIIVSAESVIRLISKVYLLLLLHFRKQKKVWVSM